MGVHDPAPRPLLEALAATDRSLSNDDDVDRVSHWMGRVNKKAAEWLQKFCPTVLRIPGMQHCGGGIATDRFDAFSALVDWVENGNAPDRIVASANPANPGLDDLTPPISPTRTRPLCRYPRYARYKGAGCIDDAASFVCALPKRHERE